jgi:hypothetical protein
VQHIKGESGSAQQVEEAEREEKDDTLLAGDVPGFSAKRLVIFACILVGYSCYYLTRNSLTFTAPVLVPPPPPFHPLFCTATFATNPNTQGCVQ